MAGQSINNIGVKESQARSALKKIFDPHSEVSIEAIFAEHFEMRYDERKVILSVDSINEFLEFSLENDADSIGDELREKLRRLKRVIDRLLRS